MEQISSTSSHVPLTRRLERIVGADAAEDLRQEAFARAWKSAPRDAEHGHLRAWVHRTAHNLAVDELRRRRVRDWVPYADETIGSTPDPDPDARIAAREALDRLSAARAAADPAALRGRTVAGRDRPAAGHVRGRRAQARRPRAPGARGGPPRGHAARAPARAGAGVAHRGPGARTSAGSPRRAASRACSTATGSSARSRPPTRWSSRAATSTCTRACTAQPNVAARGAVDLETDRRDLAALRAALVQDVPVVGICRGHQLLNIAFGGTLHQDIGGHSDAAHPVATGVAARSMRRDLRARHRGRERPPPVGFAGSAAGCGCRRRRSTASSSRSSCPAAASPSACSGIPSTRRQARAGARLGEALRPGGRGMSAAMVIRRAVPADATALRRLALLDDAQPLRGDQLVALVDGELRAAFAIGDGRAIADPFTAHRRAGRPAANACSPDRSRPRAAPPRAPAARATADGLARLPSSVFRLPSLVCPAMADDCIFCAIVRATPQRRRSTRTSTRSRSWTSTRGRAGTCS